MYTQSRGKGGASVDGKRTTVFTSLGWGIHLCPDAPRTSQPATTLRHPPEGTLGRNVWQINRLVLLPVGISRLGSLTLPLPRVINFKFLPQPNHKYYITQYEELGFSSLSWMKHNYTSNSHYLTCTFLLKKVRRILFWNLGVKGSTRINGKWTRVSAFIGGWKWSSHLLFWWRMRHVNSLPWSSRTLV